MTAEYGFEYIGHMAAERGCMRGQGHYEQSMQMFLHGGACPTSVGRKRPVSFVGPKAAEVDLFVRDLSCDYGKVSQSELSQSEL
jgi:hypothetical protein